MIRMKALKLTYIYVLISIIFGPGLLYLSHELFPKQIACFDLESSTAYYLLKDGGPRIPHAEVIQQYHLTALFLTIGSLFMMTIGVRLLTLVLTKQGNLPRKHKIITSTLIFAVLLGYVMILACSALYVLCASI